MKILNSFQLKIIMCIFMFMDHMAEFIPGTPLWFRYIGRVVAPIFFFLLIEGYFHTKNKTAYAKRLFIFALIMLIVNRLLDSLIFPAKNIGIHNNIFLSLFWGVMLLNSIEKYKISYEDKKSNLISILLISILSMFSEASFLGLGMVLIFYFYKEKILIRDLLYILLSLSTIFLFGSISLTSLLSENFQWMMVFSLLFIHMYNGKKGLGLKYFFYIFYPLHVWILYIISYYMSK